LINFSSIGKAFEDGKYHYQYVFKSATPAPSNPGYIVDCGQSSGSPKYNAYVALPLFATPLTGSGNAGVYVGSFLPSHDKYLVSWGARTRGNFSAPSFITLLDYVMFYPLIDGDETGLQEMDNTLTLPRYTTGNGVFPMLISSAPVTSTAQVTITYTNQNGVAGRTTTKTNVVSVNAGGVISGAADTASSANTVTPFFPLDANDSGVRSIQSVQIASGIGGFFAIALVKPIASLNVFESAMTSEKMFAFETKKLPKIEQGAYLNFIINRGLGMNNNSLTSELIFLNI
jgi:hypothetical protein